MKCTIQDKSSFSNIPNPLYFSQDLKLYILETYFIWGEKKKQNKVFLAFLAISYYILTTLTYIYVTIYTEDICNINVSGDYYTVILELYCYQILQRKIV